MADISDVENELVAAVNAIVYPVLNGPSISNSDIVVYPGWPSADNLATDLANGKTHISVFPTSQERNTTRYPEDEHVVTPPAPTLSFSGFLPEDYDSGDWDDGEFWDQGYVTLGGTVSVPQNVALRVNGKFYVYAVKSNDTLATIAAALAALVVIDVPNTSASGSTLTMGPGARLQAARAGGFGTIAKEVRRQERVMMIAVWANAPQLRDQIAAAVDVALAETKFLTLPDGFGARLVYKSSMIIDAQQKADLYRRDLNYSVEYATTVSKQRAAVIAPSIALKGNFSTTTNITF